MRCPALQRGLLGLALAASPGAAAAEETPPLRFDPFAPPSAVRAPEAGGGAERSGPAPGWAPVLTGTVVAGASSLANLAGVILRIGDEAHGYRLLEVREGEAVFARGEAEVVLRVESFAEAGTP